MAVFAEIQNLNALIVGASGGIGFGLVQKLLQDDRVVKIYATYRQPESASELLALEREHPEQLVCLPLEITDEAQIAECRDRIQSQVNKLHLLINCVGILHEGDLQPEKSLRQINPDHLMRYFQINSMGAVLLAKHLSPLLAHSERNVFATISAKIGSIGDNQLGGWYGYRASKAALNMLMRTVALEYRRKSPNTIVVMLHPGTTDTRLSKPFQRNVPPEKLFPVDRTVAQLLAVIENLESKDSGEFFAWDGSRLPW
jgi:NAD(P)-dependent dehydrogenase (short-subunit alcohol dehydrogenase family)